MHVDVIVIGGGAAGLIAAGRAAQCGARVVLLEQMNQPARKLLITGKGRCNITNDAPISEYYQHIFPAGRFLKHAFSRFFAPDMVQLLETYGVKTLTERGGRVFPESNAARDIAQALLAYCSDHGVKVLTGCKVIGLIQQENSIRGVEYFAPEGPQTLQASRVIICTGGNSYPATGSDGNFYKHLRQLGHTVEAVRPALVPLETQGDLAQRMQGLSLKNVKASLWVNDKKQVEEFGEMLFTHFGLSGPIVLTLSRLAVDALRNNARLSLSVDLKPALDEQTLDNRLLRDLNEHGKKQIKHLFKLWLPAKMIDVFLEELQIAPDKQGHQISSRERRSIMLLMKNLRFEVSGHRSFKEAIITAGGVVTKEIDSKRMESKIVSGLFFAGEVMDLDANTGGYNLQIAWSTGWLAGESAAAMPADNLA